MLAQPIALPLLPQDVINLRPQDIAKYYVAELETWLPHLQQALDVPSGLGKLDRN